MKRIILSVALLLAAARSEAFEVVFHAAAGKTLSASSNGSCVRTPNEFNGVLPKTTMDCASSPNVVESFWTDVQIPTNDTTAAFTCYITFSRASGSSDSGKRYCFALSLMAWPNGTHPDANLVTMDQAQAFPLGDEQTNSTNASVFTSGRDDEPLQAAFSAYTVKYPVYGTPNTTASCNASTAPCDGLQLTAYLYRNNLCSNNSPRTAKIEKITCLN